MMANKGCSLVDNGQETTVLMVVDDKGRSGWLLFINSKCNWTTIAVAVVVEDSRNGYDDVVKRH